MKKWFALVTAAMLVLAGSRAFAAAPSTAVTDHLGGYLDRVKLRDEPSTGGRVLGKYFAGVRVEVLDRREASTGDRPQYFAGARADAQENGGEWWRIRIGDREGYMMSRFLNVSADVPMTEGISAMKCTPYLTDAPLLYGRPDENAEVLATMDRYAINVLATIGMDWLQVRYRTANDESITGYARSDEIAMAENFSGIQVDTGDVKNRLNLREAPSRSSASLGRYYCGVTACRLFDDHTNGSGWTRVRIGDAVGYMQDQYLQYVSDAVPVALPPLSHTLVDPIPLFGGWNAQAAVDSVAAGDAFAVLGERGSRYYIRIETGVPWQYRYGYVEKTSVRSVARAVSVIGRMNTSQPLYDFLNGESTLSPLNVTVPAGAAVSILGSLSTASGQMISHYIRRSDEWLYGSVELGPNESRFAFVLRSAVTYDSELEYPVAE